MITGIKRPRFIIKGGTITGLRISAVDGTAFLDNCSALLPYMDGRSRIQLLDDSGRILEGVLGLRGVSESAPDGEILTNGTFDTDTDWTKDSGWSISGGNAISDGVSNDSGLYQAKSLVAQALYKGVITFTRISGNARFYIGETFINVSTLSSTDTCYLTHINTGTYNIKIRSFYWNASVDSASVQKITAPSNQGCLIKNDTGVQNFIEKNASFTYNAASYRYEIYSAQARKTYFIPGTETAVGQPLIKRLGGVQYAALNRGVF